MKVLLINCSPHEHGTTSAALEAVAETLRADGVETELFFPGSGSVQPCMACGACKKTGRCVRDDCVNEAIEKMAHCDGLVVGTPVHYAAASGIASVFLDRLFYAGGKAMRHKPAAGVICCRRAGAVSAFDELNKYFTISQMPVVSSQYWNVVFGQDAESARQDLEGMQTMRTLGHNMAWLLKCIAAGREQGIVPPAQEPPVRTNFIR